MKRTIISIAALVGLSLAATAQQVPANLRKSAVNTASDENGVSIYKAGQVIYNAGKVVNVTKVQGKDLSAPSTTTDVNYAGARETYAYDAKNNVLYTVVSKKGQSSIQANGASVVPSAAVLKANKGGDTYEGSSLVYHRWIFKPKNVVKYSAKQPSLSADGQRLYFASDMLGGYGGYDIYYLTRNADGSWSEPVNAGNSINSVGNDEYPFLYDGILLFSSNRDGKYNLYSYDKSLKKLAELNSASDDLNPVVSGETGMFVSNRDGNDDIYLFDAAYLKPAPAPKPAPKPEPKPEPKPAPKPEKLTQEEETVVLEAFNNLVFDTGKYTIKGGFAQLDKLAELLKKYPKSSAKLSGYTDNVGNDASNLKLSQNRADAVKKYLVSKGVAQTQVNAVGYGEANPVASNATADGRAKNRRVEIDVNK